MARIESWSTSKSIMFLLLFFVGINAIQAQLKIEAEDYIEMNGIALQTTSDIGGGLNVGWFDANDWLEYEVYVPFAGDYSFGFRVAGEIGGTLLVKEESVELCSVVVAATGGWQVWESIQQENTVFLEEGVHYLRLVSKTGGFNLNWFNVTLLDPLDEDTPSAPEILSAKGGVHSINLTWTKSFDATSAVAGYNVLNDDEFMSFCTDTNFLVDGLAHNTTFNLSVVAVDVAGNESSASEVVVQTDTLPWDLLWNDEFDYEGAIDSEKWYFETGGHGWGNDEKQYYTDGDNASVADGVLTIVARKESYNGNAFTSSRINSRPEYDILFGRIEVKAKLPSTNGTWPAIWTLPTDWVYGGWPDCGEFDIMEHSATYGYGHVFGTIHTGAYNHQDGTQKSGGITFDDVTDIYHTYVLEWYPDHADWYIDDVHVFRFDNEYKTSAEWPYDIKHHLLLNVAIGGGLGGDIDYDGAWPQQMIIDYVRVYDFNLGENDTIPPSTPTGFVADPKWYSVDLAWNVASDNHAVEFYYLYLDEELKDSVLGTSFLMQNLESLTTYKVGIQAKDYAGNLSEINTIEFTTTAVDPILIPGNIKAVDYTFMEGIQTEACEDFDGGENVGWIDAGDWLQYTVDVQESGSYYAGFRLASQSTSGSFVLKNDMGTELLSSESPITGGWQTWETVVAGPFDLSAGIQEIRFETLSEGFNLNWINIGDEEFAMSIKQPSTIPLSIYPNPLSGNVFMIAFTEDVDAALVLIVTPDGKVIYESKLAVESGTITVDNVDLNNGVYFVSVISNKRSETQALTVSR